MWLARPPASAVGLGTVQLPCGPRRGINESKGDIYRGRKRKTACFLGPNIPARAANPSQAATLWVLALSHELQGSEFIEEFISSITTESPCVFYSFSCRDAVCG